MRPRVEEYAAAQGWYQAVWALTCQPRRSAVEPAPLVAVGGCQRPSLEVRTMRLPLEAGMTFAFGPLAYIEALVRAAWRSSRPRVVSVHARTKRSCRVSRR